MRLLAVCLLLALLPLLMAQNICLKAECQSQIDACDASCVALMGKCTFACSMSSLGCLEQCIGANDAAQNMLECSFNKCINL